MKDEIGIKDYLVLRSFFVSTAMIFDYFGIKLISMLIFLAVLGVFAVIIEYKLYKKFKIAFANLQFNS